MEWHANLCEVCYDMRRWAALWPNAPAEASNSHETLCIRYLRIRSSFHDNPGGYRQWPGAYAPDGLEQLEQVRLRRFRGRGARRRRRHGEEWHERRGLPVHRNRRLLADLARRGRQYSGRSEAFPQRHQSAGGLRALAGHEIRPLLE